ncbi:MAG: hypothetical protein ACTJHT_07055 [Sphingobacterium sp.]|uniref:hypothetical protein n=1 Tax=Sphingobacterium sp. JB170 TaxID=1434842 RepID=UPI00097EA107|nr:hypothetical protein [Sphingobacterium sp. JB170]SJN48527.1 hypothetical protein FM107_17345 [Sphingobacterium sp. JB170]
MKPKTIIFALISALVLIILFNNKEEASFWLFGEIRTSKLLILGIFFLLGVTTGGILFRRKKGRPKDYSINNSSDVDGQTDPLDPTDPQQLSEEDKKFLGR